MLITYVTGNKVIFKTPPRLSSTEFSMQCMLRDSSLDLVPRILGENHLFTTHVQVEGMFEKHSSVVHQTRAAITDLRSFSTHL